MQPYRDYNPSELFELIDDLDFDDDELLSMFGLPEAGGSAAGASKKNKIIAWAAQGMVFVVCMIMIVGSILFIFNDSPDRSLFGYRIFRVASESMTPTTQPDGTTPRGGFRVNDVIVVRIADASQVQEGDIVTLCRGEDLDPLTHRVMEIRESHWDETGVEFLTKGDNNPGFDELPAGGSNLMGIKVLAIPRIGYVLALAQRHRTVALAICVVVLVAVLALFVLLSRNTGGSQKEKEESILKQNQALKKLMPKLLSLNPKNIKRASEQAPPDSPQAYPPQEFR